MVRKQLAGSLLMLAAASIAVAPVRLSENEHLYVRHSALFYCLIVLLFALAVCVAILGWLILKRGQQAH